MAFAVKNVRLIVAAVIAAALIAFPAFAFGQDIPAVLNDPLPATEGPAAELVGRGWQVFFSILQALGVAAGAIATWLLTRVWSWMGEKAKHTKWIGFLLRFFQALEDALELSWSELLIELEKAKSPDSPGGAEVTRDEASGLGARVWKVLKERYGSIEAFAKVGGSIIGGDVVKWAQAKVTERVVDAIDGQKYGKPGPRRNPSRPSTTG